MITLTSAYRPTSGYHQSASQSSLKTNINLPNAAIERERLNSD